MMSAASISAYLLIFESAIDTLLLIISHLSVSYATAGKVKTSVDKSGNNFGAQAFLRLKIEVVLACPVSRETSISHEEGLTTFHVKHCQRQL